MTISHTETHGEYLALASLTIRQCDEGVLVYDSLNGKTNLLNQRGALVLQAMNAEQSTDISEIAARLWKTKAGEMEELIALISSLENSGLIYRC